MGNKKVFSWPNMKINDLNFANVRLKGVGGSDAIRILFGW